MKNPVFYFKEFSVDQTGCAMKVNTDGVLLGAFANHPAPGRIVDIGTGTGVIALMLAQKFSCASVQGIELEAAAFERAKANFTSSPFASRMEVIYVDIADWKPDHKVDLIVSNPPYFINSLKNPKHEKQLARHDDGRFLNTLFSKARTSLSQEGSLWVVMPWSTKSTMLACAEQVGFSLTQEVSVYSFETDESPVRGIWEVRAHQTSSVLTTKLVLYASRGVYTDAYKTALKAYFLNF